MTPESRKPLSPKEETDSLRREVSRLKEELASLEKQLPQSNQLASPPPSETSQGAPIPDDVIIAISAALAAYLGVKPHIRQIRLIASAPWAQQGRVTIQASHILAHRQS